MRRCILSLIANPIVREDGVFTWFNTVTPTDFYCPLLYINVIKTEQMTWEEALAKVKLLSLNERKKLLRQHPALFCRLYELKQEIVNKCILDGKDKPMGKIMNRFMRAEF